MLIKREQDRKKESSPIDTITRICTDKTSYRCLSVQERFLLPTNPHGRPPPLKAEGTAALTICKS